MQRERAASALERGLPVPTPEPKRVSASAASPSSNPPGRSPAATSARMPLAVKLLGLGLALLGLVYGLTLFRDHQSTPNSAPAGTNLSGAPVNGHSAR